MKREDFISKPILNIKCAECKLGNGSCVCPSEFILLNEIATKIVWNDSIVGELITSDEPVNDNGITQTYTLNLTNMVVYTEAIREAFGYTAIEPVDKES